MVVIFAIRALATIFKVGPKFLGFGTKATIFGIKVSKNPTTGKIIASKLIQGKITKAGINFGFVLTGGDKFVANQIIGKTIKPLTSGKVTNVDEAGQANLKVLKSFLPGGPKPDIGNLLKVTIPASILPFVSGEVVESTLLTAGVPKFVVTFFEFTGAIF